jgi:hypothetical protein
LEAFPLEILEVVEVQVDNEAVADHDTLDCLGTQQDSSELTRRAGNGCPHVFLQLKR